MAKPNLKSVPRKLHVKTGDTVIVISGRSKDLLRNENSTQTGDKGKIGKVLKVFPKTGKIIVEGVNIKKRHIKPNAMNPQGEVVEREMPIFSSKVMLWDEAAGKPTRVRKEIRDGKKVRISVVSGNEI
ncbi:MULTISPECIES: 50S ribosomal protein L24 [Leptotrichia]|mgnify:FL=1|uniref:Large ribosomal subunit protein uL24 n=1 Tax=Leptotrichia wadei TaxID=157687 RepID=A0A510KZZ1_9FUSO|nr:50S ribosomal protein L24 [Leptotrichia wadei]NWO28159.1 50S ribosomal protein L24 [Leptotrichia sp. oral taxon 417]BBM55793.1 50S ribosomal protein L24 [Leptotrichia wadei]VTX67731.1 50S ribosomal protein L24 [uncultured Leptotrichia sp.]